MSGYAKLFGSILDSSIWQESKDVKILWVTMLAMKDRDGVVEAALPGLAKRAGLSISETNAALAVLLAPDEFSRTPDHEGRRVEAIRGGWQVLNHDLYRDKEDAEERRTKEALRKAKYRERTGVSRDVPSCPVLSRNVPPSDQIRSDPDPEREPPEDLEPPAPKPPEPEPAARGELTLSQRQKINHDVWEEARLSHGLLRSAGIDPHAIPWTVMPSGVGGNELAGRTIELGDIGDETYVRDTFHRVIDVAVAEAQREKHLRWFTPSRIFDRDSFWKASEISPQQARQPRGGPRVPTGPPEQLRLKHDDDAPPIHPAFRKT